MGRYEDLQLHGETLLVKWLGHFHMEPNTLAEGGLLQASMSLPLLNGSQAVGLRVLVRTLGLLLLRTFLCSLDSLTALLGMG